jgi:murein DD-endopeptidase MepM/ murein hydrolase activator NlpD
MKIIPPIRGFDKWGSGEYGAKRGNRIHKGVDVSAYAGSVVLSDINGTIKRIGYPYDPTGPKGDFRLLEIIAGETLLKYFYVRPLLPVGCEVEKGDAIGVVQDLTEIYPGITNHYHFEVLKDGENVDPISWGRAGEPS